MWLLIHKELGGWGWCRRARRMEEQSREVEQWEPCGERQWQRSQVKLEARWEIFPAKKPIALNYRCNHIFMIEPQRDPWSPSIASDFWGKSMNQIKLSSFQINLSYVSYTVTHSKTTETLNREGKIYLTFLVIHLQPSSFPVCDDYKHLHGL